MGREFRVFPAVLVREQVLSNNLGATFLPADEIQRSVDAWNGIPVVIRHPTSRGVPISARTPEVLNARGAGFLFRARFEDGALKADVFLDMERAAAMADTGDVINRVDKGEVGEISTGFGTNLEKVAGKFDGKDYDVILRDIQPDHLALLPDEIGACSVQDGCGLGVNHAGPCDAQKPDAQNSNEVPTPLPEPPAAENAAAVARDSRWQRWIASFARLLGFRKAENESDDDRRALIGAALREKYGADDRFVWIESMDSTSNTVVWSVEVQGEGEGGGLFQAEFEVAEDGSVSIGEATKVRRVTTFEPAANAGDTQPDEGDSNMNRDQMIAQLSAAGTPKEALNALSDCQLRALINAAPQPTPAATNQADESEAWRLAHQYRRELEELKTQTRNAVESEERERARLLDDVLYASNRPWSDEEVRAMGINDLRKVHAVLCRPKADYTGRGGPRASNSAATFDFVRGIMDGHKGESVLDRKEA